MGIFSVVAGLLGGKSKDKVVSTVCDLAKDASSGLDMIFYTKEEKEQDQQTRAKLNLKAGEQYLDHLAMVNKESSIQSTTRRYIAKSIVKTFLSLILMSVAVYYFYPEYSKFIMECAGKLTTLVLTVIAFYFGRHLTMEVAGAFQKKK